MWTRWGPRYQGAITQPSIHSWIGVDEGISSVSWVTRGALLNLWCFKSSESAYNRDNRDCMSMDCLQPLLWCTSAEGETQWLIVIHYNLKITHVNICCKRNIDLFILPTLSFPLSCTAITLTILGGVHQAVAPAVWKKTAMPAQHMPLVKYVRYLPTNHQTISPKLFHVRCCSSIYVFNARRKSSPKRKRTWPINKSQSERTIGSGHAIVQFAVAPCGFWKPHLIVINWSIGWSLTPLTPATNSGVHAIHRAAIHPGRLVQSSNALSPARPFNHLSMPLFGRSHDGSRTNWFVAESVFCLFLLHFPLPTNLLVVNDTTHAVRYFDMATYRVDFITQR